MSDDKEKKDLTLQSIPDVPQLSKERNELTGVQRLLQTWKLGRIERKQFEAEREILARTTIQLFEDRVREVVRAYRYQATAGTERIRKATEEYVQYFLINADVRMTAAKHDAINKAITNYSDRVADVRSDLPDELKQISMNMGRKILDDTITGIMSLQYNVDDAVRQDYPEKKGFFSKLLNC